MVGQYGLLLATSLIKDHFGEIVSKVCNCLLQKGSLQLHEIVRDTGLKQSQIKNCLLVLIQHNCVQAFSLPLKSRNEDTFGTFYMAIFDNIIHSMRYTKFLDIVEQFDSECVGLVEGLLQHGRLTFEQLVEYATSKSGNNVTREKLRVNFNKLVQGHYVEHCPKSEPLILPEAEEDARPKRRGAKFALETMTLEKQALEAATLSNAERFMEVADISADALETNDAEDFSRVGQKRRHGDLDVEEEDQALNAGKEILWRANFEKFVQLLKAKACVANKRSRLGPDAATVLKAMIGSSNSQDTASFLAGYGQIKSCLDDIFERLGGIPEAHITNIQHARTILDELGCSSSVEDGKTFFTIDMKEIIKDCQLDEVESLILARYGQDACRIFRLLAKNNKPFETDKISDVAFVDKKIALGLLLTLWKNNYLHMEKMVSGVSSKSHFLWKVNRNAVWEHLLDDMYHAALNLNQRIALNYEKDKEIADRKSDNSMHKQLQARYFKRKWLLECSLLKLDDSILLFHDFYSSTP